MDRAELIDQIANIVEKILLQYTVDASREAITRPKVKLLLISWRASRGYWSFKEDEHLNALCDICFSFDEQQIVQPEQYDQVVVCDLDTTKLSQLVSGNFESLYLQLLAQCIMLGKPVSLIADDLDSVRYGATAPKKLLQMIEKKLSILRDWGVAIISQADCVRQLECLREHSEGYYLDKHIVTKKDVEQLRDKGHRAIAVERRTIVSDIAKDYLEENQMTMTYL